MRSQVKSKGDEVLVFNFQRGFEVALPLVVRM
jgi:hypothetical protein